MRSIRTTLTDGLSGLRPAVHGHGLAALKAATAAVLAVAVLTSTWGGWATRASRSRSRRC